MKNLILISAIVMGNINANPFKSNPKVATEECFTPNKPSTLAQVLNLYTKTANTMRTQKPAACGQAHVQEIMKQKQTEKMTVAIVAFLNDVTAKMNEEMNI